MFSFTDDKILSISYRQYAVERSLEFHRNQSSWFDQNSVIAVAKAIEDYIVNGTPKDTDKAEK